jgi:anti-sigma B factor antagonist
MNHVAPEPAPAPDNRPYTIQVGDRTPAGRLTVVLAGDIDAAARADLHTALIDAVHRLQPFDTIEIDLAEVRFLDCCALGTLIAAGNIARQAGAELYITNADGIVARILHLTGVWTALTRHPTLRFHPRVGHPETRQWSGEGCPGGSSIKIPRVVPQGCGRAGPLVGPDTA